MPKYFGGGGGGLRSSGIIFRDLGSTGKVIVGSRGKKSGSWRGLSIIFRERGSTDPTPHHHGYPKLFIDLHWPMYAYDLFFPSIIVYLQVILSPPPPTANFEEVEGAF